MDKQVVSKPILIENPAEMENLRQWLAELQQRDLIICSFETISWAANYLEENIHEIVLAAVRYQVRLHKAGKYSFHNDELMVVITRREGEISVEFDVLNQGHEHADLAEDYVVCRLVDYVDGTDIFHEKIHPLLHLDLAEICRLH